MTTIQKTRALKQKNQQTIQKINEQLKSLEDQKLQLIQSIFKCSTESPRPLAKSASIQSEGTTAKISESATAFASDVSNSASNSLEKESHLYQKMTSLLSNNGSLHTLSLLCQEELGKLDKMLSFPMELKVLNGISKLETLQSLKKQKRKTKRNSNNANCTSRKSRRIKKQVSKEPEIKNLMDNDSEQMNCCNDDDIVKSLFEEWDQQPQFASPRSFNQEESNEESQMDQEGNSLENVLLNEDVVEEQTNSNYLFADSEIPQSLEIVQNPNDQTRDKTKISELHSYIQMIESMLNDTKDQLQKIID